MGIFRYFYWHFKTHPDSITYLNAPQQVDGFDIVGLDLNAIFHPVCQSYFFDKKMSVKSKKTNAGCFQAICEEIESIVNMVTPKEELILSIDGVAGLSKMNQQRQRRFRSAKEKTDEDRAIFDSNQISTGTEFLSSLSEYIRAHFTNPKTKRPYKVIIQDEKMIGEGEHKIVRYLESKQKKKICIYSPDADLIMLGIGLAKKNIFILRPNIYSNVRASHFLVNIDVFRKQLIKMVDPKKDFPEREETIVQDFVFLLFFLGNDFLPHSPSFEIKFKGIDTLIQIYSDFFQQGGFLVRTHPYAIHTKGFQTIMDALSRFEVDMIKIKHSGNRGFPNPLLDKYITNLSSRFDEYRQAYYQHYFPNIHTMDICRDYVVGLLFVGTYYYQGMPDWQYCYPFYHGPFFHELAAYSHSIMSEWIQIQFDERPPLSPVIQLLCVLPPESKRWVPECFQEFYEPSSPLIDLYPTEFKIDCDAVQNEYEGIVLLPRMDTERVEQECKRVLHRLTEKEKKRNQHQFMKE